MVRKALVAAVLVILLVVSAAAVSYAQCGPGCPICSGGVAGNLLMPKTVLGTILTVPGGEDKTTVVNVSGGITSWLNAGIGYNAAEEEVIWNVRVLVLPAAPWRPAVVAGTGSVNVGGSDQSAYLQLFKTFELREGLAVTFAGGYAADAPHFRESFGLGNVSATLLERITPFYTYDGRSSHAGVAWYPVEWLQITGYALEMREPALALGFRWNFGAPVTGDMHI